MYVWVALLVRHSFCSSFLILLLPYIFVVELLGHLRLTCLVIDLLRSRRQRALFIIVPFVALSLSLSTLRICVFVAGIDGWCISVRTYGVAATKTWPFKINVCLFAAMGRSRRTKMFVSVCKL